MITICETDFNIGHAGEIAFDKNLEDSVGDANKLLKTEFNL